MFVKNGKTYAITKRYVKHKAGEFLKGNYTVVGSPTITNDGVVSGFASRNAIAVGEFRPNSYTWEIASVVTTGSDVSTNCGITGSSNNKDYSCPVFGISSNSWRLLLSSNGSNWNIAADIKNGTVLPNTTYLVKLKFTGSQYLLEVDGNVVTTVNSTTTIYQGGSLCFGNNLYSSSGKNPFLGSIDLSQSYIKINEQYWWTGFYTKNVTEDKHYALIRRYAKHKVGDFNPSTYTVVGSPTITNAGIVSGCTKDKYLVIPKSFPANVTDLEMVWKFNQGAWGGVIVSARESIDGYSNERSVQLDCAGWFHAYLSSNGTSYDISNNLHSSLLEYNVWYYGKLTYDGSTYNLYISTDNESWTLCDSVSSTKTLAPTDGNLLIGTNGADHLYNGSIDLSESYIKINGEYWWAGFYTENVYDEKYY